MNDEIRLRPLDRATKSELVLMLRRIADDMISDIEPQPINWPQACVAAADEIERLRRDCAEAYQVCGAALLGENGPWTNEDAERVLDNLSAAANGLPRPHDDLLPWPRS